MYFIFISLFFDIIVFFIRKIYKSFDKRIIYKIYNTSIVPFFITLVLFIYGFFNIRNIIETRYTIYTDKNIEDMRILLITDSHYGDVFDKKRLDKLKRRLDKVDADIVVLGGDIVDESTTKDEMNYIFEVLGDIKNKYGIFYVYGNHDEQQYNLVSSYSDKELNNVIVDNDIVILEDSYLEIIDNVVIMGRSDYSIGRKNIFSYGFDVDKDDYIIMVDHQPVNYDDNIDFGVDLILS